MFRRWRRDGQFGVRAAAVAALALVSTVGRAAPEWNAAVVGGVAGTGHDALWSKTQVYGALRADVLFGRSREADFGFGPALEVGTVGFSDARCLAGATTLIPLGELVALGVTPGAYVRTSPTGAVGGLSGRAFVGVRSYNFAGSYALAGGILLGFDQDLDSSRQHAVVVAAQIDAALLALPVILLVAWLRGPSS